MAQLILFNKPYNVLSQFTDRTARQTLADCIDRPGVYPAGRLDRDSDSEGLLLLTDDGALAHHLTAPDRQTWKTYWDQVENVRSDADLEPLRRGIVLKDGPTRPARVRRIAQPHLWPRDPPIRYRASIPTQWLELQIQEGRNRQVRRMTAAAGFPTLRLVRWRIGDWTLDGLRPGEWRELSVPGPPSRRPKGRARPARRPRNGKL